jgi:hypothetical protein
MPFSIFSIYNYSFSLISPIFLIEYILYPLPIPIDYIDID